MWDTLYTTNIYITSLLYSTVIQVYSFPGDSDTDTGQPVGPFAVVGSNVIVQDENGEAG